MNRLKKALVVGPRVNVESIDRDRYRENWRGDFVRLCEERWGDQARVLDIGSGRSPIIAPEYRQGIRDYVGLDISRDELLAAPEGSYSRLIVRDILDPPVGSGEEFEFAVSWQVLEHVTPLQSAVDSVASYLQSDGYFVARLSGRNAVFALVNRFVPVPIGIWAMKNLLHRPPDTVFRASYDHCTYSGLREVFSGWSSLEIIAHYRGAQYFRFSRVLTRGYLFIEDLLQRKQKVEWATHYTVIARK